MQDSLTKNAENGFSRSALLIFALSCLVWFPGCTSINLNYLPGFVYASHPSLNSFSSTIISEPDLHERPPRYNKLVFLIHGWHGDASSFGDLSVLLQRDLIETHSIYTLSYWSNPFFYGPNFQRIGEFGESMSNLLGDAIKDHLQRGRPIKEISLVTHSMGGLIARDAILRMAKQDPTPLDGLTIKLVLVGTPTQGAGAAHAVEKIINGVTSPLTWVASLFVRIMPWYSDRALVWDRQAHDMRHLGKINHAVALKPAFIADQTFQWWNRFKSESSTNGHVNIDTLAVIGVEKIDNPEKEEGDGIVHGIDVPFNATPLRRRCYVAQRHWDGIVLIKNREHKVYLLIKAMIAGQQDPTILENMCATDRNGRLPTWVVVARDIPASNSVTPTKGVTVTMTPFDDPERTSDLFPKWTLDLAATSVDLLYTVFVGGPVSVETNGRGTSRAGNILGAYMLYWPRNDGQDIREVTLDV